VTNPLDHLTGRLPHGWRITLDWIITIAGAVAIVFGVKEYVVNPYRIPSASMEPTLHCEQPESGCEATRFSDRVLTNRLVYKVKSPQRGDIVVFHTPPEARICGGAGGDVFVKRLIVLPGETWRMENGVVYINGRKLVEPYIAPQRRGDTTRPPAKVEEGEYIMLGDNRTLSCDSRMWGTVPRGNFIGKVFAVYWPPARMSLR
jgi:signal peptidase I